MKCDHSRCWRDAVVYIPGTPLAFCSAHAIVGLGTWPMRRLRELETAFQDSRRLRSSDGASGATGSGVYERFPSSAPEPTPLDALGERLGAWLLADERTTR